MKIQIYNKRNSFKNPMKEKLIDILDELKIKLLKNNIGICKCELDDINVIFELYKKDYNYPLGITVIKNREIFCDITNINDFIEYLLKEYENPDLILERIIFKLLT